MKSIGLSGIGSRQVNEDAYYSDNNIFIVCDGVGGANYGEVASKLASSSLSDYFKQNPAPVYDCNYLGKALGSAIQQFKDTEAKYPELKGMKTTIVLIAFDADGAIVAWFGDSRLYHIRNGQILFVTEDHSLINQLAKLGQDVSNIQRSIITKSLSAKTETEFSFHGIPKDVIQTGDFFFLCTDGVLETITDDILCRELNTNNSVEEKAQKLCSLCEMKAKDNFTFQLIEV